MKHSSTKSIKTPRLILRRFTENDATAMFHNWASNEHVTKFLRWPAHKDISVTTCVVSEWLNSYDNEDYYQWAIVPDDINEPIGCIGVVSLNEDAKTMHIGYAIGEQWWRKGYTSEALSAIIDYLFTTTDVNRIESQHDPENPNSGKVMMKCGMTKEAILKQSDFSNRGIVDACIHRILREEWSVKHGHNN